MSPALTGIKKRKFISFVDGMKEKIKAGKKSQTRRVVYPQPIACVPVLNVRKELLYLDTFGDGSRKKTECLYKVGDIVQVKGTNILIEITRVWVEKLRDIPPQDCIEEGITEWDSAYGFWPNDDYDAFMEFEEKQVKNAFATLWDSIHKENRWDDNPLVWVLHFKYLRGE